MKNTIRVQKHEKQRQQTAIAKNQGIIGDSIEVMLERLREGEGEEGIQDRDLVYNDNETSAVNPITNIRTDRFEAMLEEKIGEYEHKHRKLKIVKDEDPKPEDEKEPGANGTENPKE